MFKIFFLTLVCFLNLLTHSYAKQASLEEIKEWRTFIESFMLENDNLQVFDRAQDVSRFCPNYSHLTLEKKSAFWAEFFLSVAKQESGLDPKNWMKENLGIDSVTQKQVRSEGLLQLSYQDVKNYNELEDCGISWEKDKKKNQNDPRKTIFDPIVNLRCGLLIMKHQIERYSAITMKRNVYWSTLRIGGRNGKIKLIKKDTHALDFCR